MLNNLAIAIQHHPSRAHLLERLVPPLADIGRVEIIEDPQPSGRRDAWRTHKACLQSLPSWAAHLFVVQDDAIPQPDLYLRVADALYLHPETILLAFVPGFSRERSQQAAARKTHASYAPFMVTSYVPTVAVIYPRDVAEAFLAWTEGKRLSGADDGLLATFCRKHKMRPLMMVPCAVEHDEHVETIARERRMKGPHRRAALL